MPRPARRHTAAVTAALSAAVLCAFPLYIEKFSNLGVVKFTAGMVLCFAGALWLAGCAAVGARPEPERFADAGRDLTLWALAAFVLVNSAATALSLDNYASLWGLRGYYGGLLLAEYTAAAYLAVRSFADTADIGPLLCGMGWAAAVITVLYALNMFDIDPLGAYEGIFPTLRGQFFSTLGQFDFVAGGLSILLPPVFYLFVTAPDRRRALVFAGPALAGMLALDIVNAEGLLLGVGAAALVCVCCRGFRTWHLRRALLLGAAFFAWAGLLDALRARFPVYSEAPLPALLGRWALPGGLFCLAAWALLGRCRDRALHIAGRVLTAALFAAAALGMALANLWPGWPQTPLDNFLVLGWPWGSWRGLIWSAAWDAWRDAPLWRQLLGFGPCMTRDAIALWTPGSGIDWPDMLVTYYAAHSEYLEQLLTTGAVGLVAWVVFAGAHLRRAWRCRRRPGVVPVALALVSYLAQAAVSIRVSMTFPLVMVLFGWLAALTAPVADDAALPAKAAPATRRAGVWLAAILAVPACGAAGRLLFGFLF